MVGATRVTGLALQEAARLALLEAARWYWEATRQLPERRTALLEARLALQRQHDWCWSSTTGATGSSTTGATGAATGATGGNKTGAGQHDWRGGARLALLEAARWRYRQHDWRYRGTTGAGSSTTGFTEQRLALQEAARLALQEQHDWRYWKQHDWRYRR